MAPTRSILSVVALTLLVHGSADAINQDYLKDNFYDQLCPDAEYVIQKAVFAELDKNLRNAAGVIRLQFHDCFVGGCEASVLLDGVDTEKSSVSAHLRGFEVVDAAKRAVEAICPGVVSCADVLAYAARDSAIKLNATGWAVQGGRKDGLLSFSVAAAEEEIPSPDLDVTQLIENFARKGLSTRQMVILSGSHTSGVGHCDKFTDRLYNFSAACPTDPSLNPKYAEELKKKCPESTFNKSIQISMDSITPLALDSNYFVGLKKRKGLFTSDQSLFEDLRTRDIVKSLVDKGRFDFEFGEAMRAMGAIEVKAQGQIRQNCRKVNPW
ncbi:hypothetical protein Mapa_014590 [Marchantia paleacea]|nr:hypothetical protein Mapa_014590 [Marchantia paleacea]